MKRCERLCCWARDFTERDDADAPAVVIINQEFARRFYGAAEQALGKRFRFAQGTPLMEVIGIAKDGLYNSLYEDRQPNMLLPLYQQQYGAVTLLISTQSAGDIQPVAESARREITQMDARLPPWCASWVTQGIFPKGKNAPHTPSLIR